MRGYVFSLIAGLCTLVLMVELLRRRRLREKYAVLWLVVGLGVLVLSIVPSVLDTISNALGVETPANLLFLVTGLVLLMVSVQLSSEVSTLEEETRTLAEEVALLRLRQDEMRDRLEDRRSGDQRCAQSPRDQPRIASALADQEAPLDDYA